MGRKLIAVDENYLKNPVYRPWPELTEEEREEMRLRYEELLPRYKNKPETIIGKGGQSAMDILHNAILEGPKAKAVTVQRTERTRMIREAQKESEYLSLVATTCEQPNHFDAKAYMVERKGSLLEIFNVVNI